MLCRHTVRSGTWMKKKPIDNVHMHHDIQRSMPVKDLWNVFPPKEWKGSRLEWLAVHKARVEALDSKYKNKSNLNNSDIEEKANKLMKKLGQCLKNRYEGSCLKPV